MDLYQRIIEDCKSETAKRLPHKAFGLEDPQECDGRTTRTAKGPKFVLRRVRSDRLWSSQRRAVGDIQIRVAEPSPSQLTDMALLTQAPAQPSCPALTRRRQWSRSRIASAAEQRMP